MGYPIIGATKTLVLPIPNEPLSVQEYNEKYGIDVRGFLTLTDDGYIRLNKGLPNTLVLIDDMELTYSQMRIYTVKELSEVSYSSEIQDGALGLFFIGGIDSGTSLRFYIPKDVEFNLDNMIVLPHEI